MRTEEIIQRCKIYQPGDKVLIKDTVKDESGHRFIDTKIEGTILQRYPHMILVDKQGVKESFTYSDVAINNRFEKKLKKSGGKRNEKYRNCKKA